MRRSNPALGLSELRRAEAARLYRTYVNRRLRQEKFAPPLAAE